MRNRALFLLVILAPIACTSVPRVDSVESVSRSSGTFWTPPPAAIVLDRPVTTPIPADVANRVQRLTLADVTDIALRNNPATRESWSNARAAAYALGSARARLTPPIDASVSASRTRAITQGTTTGSIRERTQYVPELSLNFLLFDFGGRSGTIEAARQTVFATSLTHNATLQNTVLQVQSAYFAYMATKGLFAAQQTQLTEAKANLSAAEQRHEVGLATIADVLQARTAMSEAQLSLDTIQGELQSARGALAGGMGLPANLPYDIDANPNDIPVRDLAVSVDSVIDAAVRNRPDLQAARAEARAAAAEIGVARAASLPSVLLGGTAGRTYTTPSSVSGPTYGVTLGIQIPLFSALTNGYNVRRARAEADAATARADAVRQHVTQEVFASYYALQTATRRVSTADDLLASATQSEQVAAGRYREGVGSIIDLLTAQSALANARAQQVQARWQWATALAQLARDAGSLGLRGEAPVGLVSTPSIPPTQRAATPAAGSDTTHP